MSRWSDDKDAGGKEAALHSHMDGWLVSLCFTLLYLWLVQAEMASLRSEVARLGAEASELKEQLLEREMETYAIAKLSSRIATSGSVGGQLEAGGSCLPVQMAGWSNGSGHGV